MSTTTHHHNHTKGTTVTETEHSPKAPHSTGLFALLGAFLRGGGTGAPKITQGTRASAVILAIAALIAALPASAQAYATIEGPPKFSSAPGLPDGRVYEQVSPADKNGNSAGATTNTQANGALNHYGLAAPDGNSVLFEGSGPMGESPSGDNKLFVATKKPGESGWSTRSLLPAEQNSRVSGNGVDTLDPSLDLSHAMVGTNILLENECYLQLTGPDPFVAATGLERTEIANPVEQCGGGAVGSAPAGGTPDFSTLYFTYAGTLLPADESRTSRADGEAWGFYENHEGELREAGTLPDDSPYPGKPSPWGAVPAASGHGRAPVGNEVSADGSKAFFVSPDPASCKANGGQNECAADPPELYVREDGDTTLLVSKDTRLPEVGGLPASAPDGVQQMPNPVAQQNGEPVLDGSYVFASSDGSQAFFQSEDQLTPEAPSGSEVKTYDFDVNTGTLTYLPGVAGQILATDSDGLEFAFVRPEVGGEPAELDLWSAGPGGGTVTPIVQLPGAPSSGLYNQFVSAQYISEGQMASNGSALAFVTAARLSSAFNSGGVEQVYRYDVPAHALGCVSCAPAGVNPRGDASMSGLRASETYEAYVGEAIVGTVNDRGISADGNRIFFDSPDPLVPQDKNTNSPEIRCGENGDCPQGRDVYEWENGVVYIISTGRSPLNSYLLDSSENGNDVFFATAEGLVPGDTDGGFDVYDARIPHPGDNPPAAAVPCEGAVCQGPPNVPSPLTPPASATFSGLGNSAEETSPPSTKATTKTVKCKKDQVKKKGGCVKRPKAKKSAKRSR